MSNRSDLRAEIARIDDLMDLTSASADLPFGLRAAQTGLLAMRNQLEHELEVALRPQLEVTIQGEPVRGREISVRALSGLLASLQEAVSSIAQALTGKATTRASLPTFIREGTAISLAGVFEGSFGATLRGPVDPEAERMAAVGQTALFPPEINPTMFDTSMDAVLDIIALAAGMDTDDESIVEAVLPLGARSFKHLKDLSDVIVDNSMTAEMRWSHLGLEPRTERLNKQAARRLNDVLTLNKVTEHSTTLRGYMGTASEFHGRVEIRTDDGVVISAKVAEDLVPELGEFYTRRVQAETVRTTARSTATGLEKTTYLVLGLATIDDHPRLEVGDPS